MRDFNGTYHSPSLGGSKIFGGRGGGNFGAGEGGWGGQGGRHHDGGGRGAAVGRQVPSAERGGLVPPGDPPPPYPLASLAPLPHLDFPGASPVCPGRGVLCGSVVGAGAGADSRGRRTPAQAEVVSALSATLEAGGEDLPHLLFYGPPGTGKTTAARAIARKLYGERVRDRCLELNASDERGIGTVRGRIKQFAGGAVGKDCRCGFKLIILDESDAMTTEAQQALRRTMEVYSKVTRFIFICNYVSRIIQPLTSRCAKFRFKPFHAAVMQDRLNFIAGQEGVQLGEGALAAVGRYCGGDMRRAVTLLHSASRLFGGDVTAERVMEVAEAIPDAVVESFLRACSDGPFQAVQDQVREFVLQSYSTQRFLEQVQSTVLAMADVPDSSKALVLQALAQADGALSAGATDEVQLLSVGARCGLALQRKSPLFPLA